MRGTTRRRTPAKVEDDCDVEDTCKVKTITMWMMTAR